jgi:hypothetical protein
LVFGPVSRGPVAFVSSRLKSIEPGRSLRQTGYNDKGKLRTYRPDLLEQSEVLLRLAARKHYIRFKQPGNNLMPVRAEGSANGCRSRRLDTYERYPGHAGNSTLAQFKDLIQLII